MLETVLRGSMSPAAAARLSSCRYDNLEFFFSWRSNSMNEGKSVTSPGSQPLWCAMGPIFLAVVGAHNDHVCH
ncbi:hypothetical protein GCM10012275_08990 [Longimycelium tulufanense]|uniref:Uncharacterized protein n=1 Tax=Longimycelium tulufanense TaxID=907463 RepID=A0A8J3FSM8_9PSEU|nr:hypothetical protein GCM10012275_08990 [Longimycelium tulufanense]